MSRETCFLVFEGEMNAEGPGGEEASAGLRGERGAQSVLAEREASAVLSKRRQAQKVLAEREASADDICREEARAEGAGGEWYFGSCAGQGQGR